MNKNNFAEQINLSRTKLNVFEEFVDELVLRGWEIEPEAKQLLRESRTLLVMPSGEHFVFRTPFNKLGFTEAEVRADQVARFPADPPADGHREFPCWPDTLFKLCLDLSDKHSDEMLYVSTRTKHSGIDGVTLFKIQSVIDIHVLSLVRPDYMIRMNEKNYLVHS